MKILFVSHDAEPAGAQLLLLQFLEWLKQNRPEVHFEILLGKSGVLQQRFEAVGRVRIAVRRLKKSGSKSIIYKIREDLFYRKLKKQQFELIYLNTSVSGLYLSKLGSWGLPVISHILEMSFWFRQSGWETKELLKTFTTHFLAASNSVKDFLIQDGFCESDRVSIAPGFVSSNRMHIDSEKSIHRLLGLNSKRFLVGACGSEGFRKGKDWFIPLAIQVLRNLNSDAIHFVWIGGTTSWEIDFDLQRSGYKNQIHFITNTQNAASYFHELSLFLMLSREDPFPTVNLEAGWFQVPIVGFEKSGGTSELLVNGGGRLVPYGDLHAMAEVISEYFNQPDLRKHDGKCLSTFVQSNYEQEQVCTQILNQIIEVKNHTT